eukprot:TRINITY_DN29210_c0_g1_i1.p1 TRINITY_DN29210_c0_g1~~TRINITY_DN29210_c0_g1_i1.p1  ORF type:complete len:132 (-),score=40.48 TRINITY_DN29210_c0_g1_i1:108-479(-)
MGDRHEVLTKLMRLDPSSEGKVQVELLRQVLLITGVSAEDVARVLDAMTRLDDSRIDLRVFVDRVFEKPAGAAKDGYVASTQAPSSGGLTAAEVKRRAAALMKQKAADGGLKQALAQIPKKKT